MQTYVYRWPENGGRPVAIREGNVIYDSMGNTPLVYVEDNRIYRGQFASGAQDFTIIGNHVVAGVNGAIVFTIVGNSIGDGMGEPFLFICHDGDKKALAGAAVAFIGDMRLRQPYARVVDRSNFETATGTDRRSWDDNGVKTESYGSHGDHFHDLRAPDDLTDKYGEQEYDNDASRNFHRQGRAVSSEDRDSSRNFRGQGSSGSGWEERLAETRANVRRFEAECNAPREEEEEREVDPKDALNYAIWEKRLAPYRTVEVPFDATTKLPTLWLSADAGHKKSFIASIGLFILNIIRVILFLIWSIFAG